MARLRDLRVKAGRLEIKSFHIASLLPVRDRKKRQRRRMWILIWCTP